jgi:tetratricopeptide (TPR) repeat protein
MKNVEKNEYTPWLNESRYYKRVYIISGILLVIIFASFIYFYEPAKNTLVKTAIILFEKTKNKLTGEPKILSFAQNEYDKGRKLYLEGTYESLEKASAYFKKAYNEDKSFIEAYAKLAETYVMIGSLTNDTKVMQSGFEIANKLFENNKNSVTILRTFALFYSSLARITFYQSLKYNIHANSFNLKEFTEAQTKSINFIKKAINIDTNQFETYNIYALILLANHNLDDQTKENLNKAISLNPKYSTSYFNLALFSYLRGDHENTISILKKAIELDKNFIQAKSFLGLLENENTLKDYEKLLHSSEKRNKDIQKEVIFSDNLLYEMIESYKIIRNII